MHKKKKRVINIGIYLRPKTIRKFYLSRTYANSLDESVPGSLVDLLVWVSRLGVVWREMLSTIWAHLWRTFFLLMMIAFLLPRPPYKRDVVDNWAGAQVYSWQSQHWISLFPVGLEVMGIVGCHLLHASGFVGHKRRGGLGVQHLAYVRRACLTEHLAKCFGVSILLWSRMIVMLKYRIPRAIRDLKQPPTFSWSWQAICGSVATLREGCRRFPFFFFF